MTVVLVTGANGQVGSEIQKLSSQFPFLHFRFLTRSDLDLSTPGSIQEYLSQIKFDYLINAAAYTQVDQAEKEEGLSYKVNAEAVQCLARACAEKKAKLIQLSTDYVYHNSRNRPLLETDKTNPQSIYAQTKLAGEEFAVSEHSLSIVIRTSWVYSSFGKNFVKTMIRLGKERDVLKVVFDQIGTPTYACDLAKALLEIISWIEMNPTQEEIYGAIYNYSNEGVASWYDFSRAIFEIKNIDCEVHPIQSSEYPTLAARPPFSVMNKGKIKNTFGLMIPHWRSSLEKCLTLL